MPETNHLYACDSRWWSHWIETVTRDYDGRCWTQHQQWDHLDPAAWGIEALKSENKPGLSRVMPVIHTGKNSGYQAINLAYLLGAERILLLGYDMKMRGSQRHWFGAHPERLEVASDYASFTRCFETIKPDEYGIEIWNVTRDTALHCFPVYDFDDACAALS